MPETPATTKDEAACEEHRDAANSTLHGGAAPDPACLKRDTSNRHSEMYPGAYTCGLFKVSQLGQWNCDSER